MEEIETKSMSVTASMVGGFASSFMLVYVLNVAGMIREKHEAVAVLVVLELTWIPIWMGIGWRCGRALVALDTTRFAFGRFPPALFMILALGIAITAGAGAGIFQAMTLFICAMSLLSFCAVGSAALAIHEGTVPFMASIHIAHSLGGIFGTIVARFTFRKSPVIKRLPGHVPHLILLLAFLFAIPHVMERAFQSTLFAWPNGANQQHEQSVTVPLDGFTGAARPVGPAIKLTPEEFREATVRGGSGLPQHVIDQLR